MEIETRTLHAVAVQMGYTVDSYFLKHLQLESFDPLLPNMLLRLRSCCLAEKLDEDSVTVTARASVPQGPWQWVKWKCFPDWAKKRWPVKWYTVTETKSANFDLMRTYPDLVISDDSHRTYGFLTVRHDTN